MSDDVMRVREFIKHLDKYIQELDNGQSTPDSIDTEALAYLADDAIQDETRDKLYDLGDRLDAGTVTNEEFIKEIKEIGKEYDV
jgi:hypothetical protein